MSGICFSSGKLTNNGEKLLELSDVFDNKINSLDIYNIPLSEGILMTAARAVGKVLQPLIHPALSPSLCHIAIKLNLENVNDVIIIEYGQYLTEDSNKKSKGIFSSGSNSGSFNEPRTEYNDYKYYYINKDGVRITRITGIQKDLKNISNIAAIGTVIATGLNFYGALGIILLPSMFRNLVNGIKVINCDINNKITLRNLTDQVKGEKWLAKNYNLLTNNCQDFGAEIIRILKAIRINEEDKIRIKEKMLLPNCLIKALSKNEELSTVNIIGRIPVVGLLFDSFAAEHFIKK